MAAYKRILLKLSGEALKGEDDLYNSAHMQNIVEQVIRLAQEGVEVAIVAGGGNIWRGSMAEGIGMDRISGDYMGMLATIMNALALESVIKAAGYEKVIISSAIEINKVAQPYYIKQVNEKLKRKYIVLLTAGLGHPYFTTDSAASLRAIEIKADILLMAKNNVCGVYDANPHVAKDAKHIAVANLSDLIKLKLDIMDQTATTLALDGKLDMIVFNINEPNSIYEAAYGKGKFTKIKGV